MSEYPSAEDLERLACDESLKNPEDWLAFAREIWNCHYGKVTKMGRRWTFITGGWSGNEDIIRSMQNNQSGLWLICWYSSNRGGKHVFKVP